MAETQPWDIVAGQTAERCHNGWYFVCMKELRAFQHTKKATGGRKNAPRHSLVAKTFIDHASDMAYMDKELKLQLGPATVVPTARAMVTDTLQSLNAMLNHAVRYLQELRADANQLGRQNNPPEGLARNQKTNQVLSSSSPRSRSVSGSTPSSHLTTMDLNFVTERIMFLSFPADIQPAQYRAELRRAAAMLQTKHGHNYMVFNLSAPRRDVNKLNPHVLDMGWVEGLAPPLERLCSICKSIDSWLQADPLHTAVLHSRGGMDRIGVVVAAYMHYTTICASDDQALDRYAMQRFFDERIGFLQRPSDKRYVDYFAGLLSGSIQINGSPLYLDHVTVLGVPGFEARGGCKAFIKVYQGSVPLYTSALYHVPENARHFTISLEKGLQLRGDILVKCYHRKSKPPARETVFSCQFHTCAVAEQILVFNREALDHACHDLRFPFDGVVQLHFSTGPDTRRPVPLPQSAGVTVEKSHDDPVTRWDSYETFDTGQVEDDLLEDEEDETEENELVLHTPGPVDGSLYATVTKRSHKTRLSSSSSPLLTTVTQKSVHSVLRNKQSVDHHRDASARSTTASSLRSHHIRFLNSPHVASTDSGISSAGAGILREREAHLSGSSVSPPHSGSHSAESAVAFSDPDPTSPTPSPVPLQIKMPISVAPSPGGMALHRAEVHPTPATSGGLTLKQETSELDQLLTGMLLNVQNIPDIRPSQRLIKEIDVDSIQVHFPQLPEKTEVPASPPVYTQQQSKSPTNGITYTYESSTVLRSAMGKSSATNHPDLANSAVTTLNSNNNNNDNTQVSVDDVTEGTSGLTGDKDIPYHARQNSKPFTYGVLSNGANASPSLHRRNSKESLNVNKPGLASPSLVRKFSGGNLNLMQTQTATTPRTPLPNISPTNELAANSLTLTPRSTRKLSYDVNPIATSSPRSVNSVAPAPVPVRSHTHTATQPQPMMQDSNGFTSQALASTPMSNRSHASEFQETDTANTVLNRNNERPRPSPSQFNSTLEESVQDVSIISETSSCSEAGLTWLQRQQQKLRERKDSFRRTERSPQESRLMTELRAVQQHYGIESKKSLQTRPDDGYLSDTTLLSDWATSREGSPETGNNGRPIYSTPLHINTSSSSYSYQGMKNGASAKSDGLNTSSATMGANRSASLERSHHYSLSSTQDTQHTKTALSRQKSDLSHDRERPFMAVKRAHEQRKNSDRSPQALLQVSSPLGYTHDSLGLLTTVEGNTGTKDDSLLSLSSSNEDRGGATTPAFPVPPRTPYMNHVHHELTLSHSGAGLPPKSPTAQRRATSGAAQTSPGAGLPQTSPSVSSAAASNVKSVRKWSSNSSVSSKDRSPSPAQQWNTLDGTMYPPSSPSMYTAHSRRSSVGSLGGEPHEVSPANVNFVKDTSRFWYKPSLSREDTINLLKDKEPGTFIIRNSNSFPGAFGLAVKVTTPPANVVSRGSSGDPAAELVRHFLIEPTSRGVRLKGCPNEPVFGSLSALVYQHSVTPLALPCKLVLPETDVCDSVDSGSVSPAIQLLGQGAACNVLYLFTMDTESLTGSEAVQRTISTLFSTKPLPEPTVVHFKASSQGITLTDSERKLFFRRHYPVNAISYCGHDPEDRRWHQKNAEGVPISSNRCFGFVARKPASKTDNQCHIFAELEPEQPALAIVNFVTKVMMTGQNSRLNIV